MRARVVWVYVILVLSRFAGDERNQPLTVDTVTRTPRAECPCTSADARMVAASGAACGSRRGGSESLLWQGGPGFQAGRAEAGPVQPPPELLSSGSSSLHTDLFCRGWRAQAQGCVRRDLTLDLLTVATSPAPPARA